MSIRSIPLPTACSQFLPRRVAGAPFPGTLFIGTLFTLVALFFATLPSTAQEVWQETRADLAYERYGTTGRGVTVAVIDRGVNVTNPDFRNPDGTTRIKYLLDMSAQTNWCNQVPRPQAIEYSEAQINAALANGGPYPARDAVGHGDATLGAAAGNGRAAANGLFKGMAPEADLVVVKHTSEGAPAHGTQPAEAPFVSCLDDAIDWVAQKMNALGQPGVLIINSGTQWGPIDGTSAVSRKLASAFPSNRPGRVVVMPAGDEGSLASHAGGTFSSTQPANVRFRRTASFPTAVPLWYDGNRPAQITVSLDSGETIGPVGPGQSMAGSQVTIVNYNPGQEFYPWRSTSGDRAVYILLQNYQGEGTITIRGLTLATGRFDAYSDVVGANLTPVTQFTSHLVPGRLTDYASTPTVIPVGNYNLRTHWTDVNGVQRSITNQGDRFDLWLKSPGGPTRDGRNHGVDIAAPGQQSFTSTTPPYSFWSTLGHSLIQEGDGRYIRFGGTSGSAPIVTGAVARLLQLDPTLTTAEVRQILRASARTDEYTGGVPNVFWGWGKLDVNAAHDRAACDAGEGLCLNGGRFLTRVSWRDFRGNTGQGKLVPFRSDDSGLFHFFSADNWEMLVKVLDGCGFNQRFWVFAAATTDVEYTLEVTDLETGDVRTYFNPLGNPSRAITDSSAFATCSAERSSEPQPPLVASTSIGIERTVAGPPASDLAHSREVAASCSNSQNSICLNRGRFRVQVDWRDFQGNTGGGKVVPFRSDDSGLFTFFTDDNWEMLVKVLDGCALNDRFWVFAAATTNVEFTLRVTDTATGAESTYHNPLGVSAPAITDTFAFETCG